MLHRHQSCLISTLRALIRNVDLVRWTLGSLPRLHEPCQAPQVSHPYALPLHPLLLPALARSEFLADLGDPQASQFLCPERALLGHAL